MSPPLTETTSEHGGLPVVSVGPPAGEPVEAAALLCHGFGAPGTDLVGLGAELFRRRPALAGRVRLHFPAAPLDLGPMGMAGGRAWWLFQLSDFGLPPEKRSARLRAERPPKVEELRALIDSVADSLLTSDGLPSGSLVVGGFSQGAMLMTDYALRHVDRELGGLAVFSGAYAAETDWRPWASDCPTRSVYLSHGRQDGILPFAGAADLRDMLAEAGHEVRFEAFDGSHTIPPCALDGLGDLLEAACGG